VSCYSPSLLPHPSSSNQFESTRKNNVSIPIKVWAFFTSAHRHSAVRVQLETRTRFHLWGGLTDTTAGCVAGTVLRSAQSRVSLAFGSRWACICVWPWMGPWAMGRGQLIIIISLVARVCSGVANSAGLGA
jgi:hypothetical protein